MQPATQTGFGGLIGSPMMSDGLEASVGPIGQVRVSELSELQDFCLGNMATPSMVATFDVA